MVDDVEDAIAVYKNHMGGETFDGASKASDILNEQIAKMQELNAKAETERAVAKEKMAHMSAEVSKLRATAEQATAAATTAAATAAATKSSVQGLAENVGAFGTAVAKEQEKLEEKLDGVADQVLDKVKAAFMVNLLKGGGSSAEAEIHEVESPAGG